jgi:hypothetical protein
LLTLRALAASRSPRQKFCFLHAFFLLVKAKENASIYLMKTVKPKPETCQPKPAPPAPLFDQVKRLPQSLSLEEARLQFQQNNRLASSRKRP